MFNRLSTVLHNAVDALAPPLPAKEEFVYHWKAVTKFFIDRRSDSKAPIESTNIPGHLEEMLYLLCAEDEETSQTNNAGTTMGPCIEYMLQHKLLDTLQTLARADCPPGMKQYILMFVSKLLSEIRQPLLPHVGIYRSVIYLTKLCGETKAAPTETEEIIFLEILCDKLKEDPSLVNFFLDLGFSQSLFKIPRKNSVSRTDTNVENCADEHQLPDFPLVNSLLTLCQSADSRVAIKACERLTQCASLSIDLAARCLVEKTKFVQVMSERLVTLYETVPKTLDPICLEQVQTKWGAENGGDDLPTFPGKQKVVNFFSWLDYCNKIVQEAYPIVADSLARSIHSHFLVGSLEPALRQVSESGAILAATFLIKCLQQMTAEVLLKEFGYFLLGESRDAEIQGVVPHSMKHLLLERCSHPNDEVTLVMLKVFETLLENPIESVLHNLILANLLSRNYYDHAATDCLASWSDEEDERIRRGNYEDIKVSPGSSPISRTMAPSNIHKIINCFLLLLPDELKSCESDEEMGYENYLHDAQRQFREWTMLCAPFDWPHEAVSREEMHQSDTSSSESQAEAEGDRQASFYEGSFLAMILDKMEAILDQSYEVSLQVTSIVSKLALLPHPNVHEFILNPLIPVPDNCRTLFISLLKVVGDIQVRIQRIPSFKRKLYLTRRVMLGDNADYSSVEGSSLLEGLIVLEEFSKELAAISFVKYRASS